MKQEPARTFRDLIVWKKAHTLVLSIYKYTDTFPKKETYGISHQMRRAAVSVPANIAEGFRKHSKREKTRFMNIAESSLEESRYYLVLAQDLNYGRTDDLMALLEDVSRLLYGYIRAIPKETPYRPPSP